MSEQGARMVADRWVEDESFREHLRRDPETAARSIGAELDPEQTDYLRSLDWSQSDQQLEELVTKARLYC
jgi:hypothetical protein